MEFTTSTKNLLRWDYFAPGKFFPRNCLSKLSEFWLYLLDNDDRIDELNEDILDDELEEYFKQHPRKKKTSLELVESEPEDFYGSWKLRAS